MNENFKDKILEIIRRVPKGKVVSYGQVAAAAGFPTYARHVGKVLSELDENTKVPWWRVVNNQGYISIKGNWIATKEIQRTLLLQERIEVDKDFRLDMKRHRHVWIM